MIRALLERHAYLRFRDNWHKHPLVAKVMCALGRHDYEAHSLDGEWVELRCMYCWHGKKSHLMEANDGKE